MDEFGLGFRVPAIVISPWVKPHYIDNTQYEFASMLRFAETVFNLPTLGTRDTHVNDMMSMFDFNQAPLPTLVEPANFFQEAPVSSTTTTQSTTQTTSQPASSSGYLLPAVGIAAIVLIVAGIAYVAGRRYMRPRVPKANSLPARNDALRKHITHGFIPVPWSPPPR